MSNFKADFASGHDLERWDDFITRSCNGTMFHLQRFLGYHGDRFSQAERHLVIRKGGEPVAQLSYAVTSADGKVKATSPYGGSYGGFALRYPPSYSEACGIADALVHHLSEQGIGHFVVTPPLPCCCSKPLDTMTFALLERGFRSTNRDVSSILNLDPGIDLANIMTARARNMVRKAQRLSVTVRSGAPMADFWSMMEATFSRHGTRPTHTREELVDLLARLPDRVSLDVAYLDDAPVAGACCFVVNRRVATSFYLCQNEVGRDVQALSLLIFEALERYKVQSVSVFDFGTSTHGMSARPGLFQFKESFGAHGQFRESFEHVA